jgi:hypothetical protein
MKIAFLVVLSALSPSVWGQDKPIPTVQETPSVSEQIRADRAKANAREESESKKRPWDRDADGKRPWDRKEVPSPKE